MTLAGTGNDATVGGGLPRSSGTARLIRSTRDGPNALQICARHFGKRMLGSFHTVFGLVLPHRALPHFAHALGTRAQLADPRTSPRLGRA
jgi:hypothetical protein